MRMCENFRAGRPCQFPAVTPRIQTCCTHSSHFVFTQDDRTLRIEQGYPIMRRKGGVTSHLKDSAYAALILAGKKKVGYFLKSGNIYFIGGHFRGRYTRCRGCSRRILGPTGREGSLDKNKLIS